MIFPQQFGIKSDRVASYDIMTEAHICNGLVERFGIAVINGTVIAKNTLLKNGKTGVICCENQFRKYLKNITNAVEIGTKFGVGSLLLAHYAYHLTTIDVFARTEPLAIWDFFGVNRKITYAVAKDNNEKIDYLKDKEFDLALIDGNHSYDDVKLDFEIVKKCGRVLFHDYSLEPPVHEGVIKFVDELPKEEMVYDVPFAYWEKK